MKKYRSEEKTRTARSAVRATHFQRVDQDDIFRPVERLDAATEIDRDKENAVRISQAVNV